MTFKRSIWHRQATDHLLGAKLPKNTPQKNNYVNGVIPQKHDCLGSIYIHPLAMTQMKEKRGIKRWLINAADAEKDSQLLIIRAAAERIDTLQLFNSPNGPPQLEENQKPTAHQLLGYAARSVATALHIYLRFPAPPQGRVKRLKWTILRTMTSWRG